ncbi:sensor histidine kinase N-terminal domain-containing protein [Pseudogemmobacter sp. W21_MBD1_M6]|uniref:sensor histidine kinase n=1 Tax=Pseudogemmobacter sp. W21_MBD1_M6 TaxID=3240271 RepID=UPI003F9E1659
MNSWSLRSRLFVLIVLPLIVIAAFASIARYMMAERMSERLYDNTLLAVALTISRDVVLSEGDVLAEQLLDELTKALGDPVYYQVTGPDGRFVTGYSNPPQMPKDAKVTRGVPYFYDAVVLGQPVRAVVLQEFISEPQFGGWVTVEVWQTVFQRDALSLQLLTQAIILMTTVIASAALLVWFGINRGLRPLLKLREAVALRSPDDLGPIRRKVPREVRSLVTAMNALFSRLSEAFALRDAFISDAAHQLRNPIAAIQAQAEAATTAPNEAELRSRVAELADTARRTGRLTQQLLSMEKARGRGASVQLKDTDLTRLVGDLARRSAETALRMGVSVSLDVRGQARPVPVDAVMIGEAVENLLDNALRYGCPAGGEVNIDLVYDPDSVTIRVADTGPGIPPEHRNRVFDRFYRIADDTTGGCGLGLAIVQKVAEAHNGTAQIGAGETGAAVEMILPIAPVRLMDIDEGDSPSRPLA